MIRRLIPEKHESKKRGILAAAQRCFLREGLQGASIAAICKEAEISPGHLYHYFSSKDEIIAEMAEEYLAQLHAHFGRHAKGEETAAVLLSEIWSMEGWEDLAHCNILFELLAEAGRSEKIRAVLKANTDGIRALLTETLKAGQARGEVDPNLDLKHTSAILVAVLDTTPMLPLMTDDISFAESRKLITLMLRRFLRPGK